MVMLLFSSGFSQSQAITSSVAQLVFSLSTFSHIHHHYTRRTPSYSTVLPCTIHPDKGPVQFMPPLCLTTITYHLLYTFVNHRQLSNYHCACLWIYS